MSKPNKHCSSSTCRLQLSDWIMAHVDRKGKHKKKNNFLRQAKRHGKKGNYGKGRRLSEEEYSYYMKVFEQLKHLKGEEKGKWFSILLVLVQS